MITRLSKLHIYTALTLTTAQDSRPRDAVDVVAAHFERRGCIVYCPHKHSDPTLHPDLSPQDVNARNISKIAASDFVFVEVSGPSHGVGYEVRTAENYGVPVILLIPSTTQKLSRRLSGSPIIAAEITYDHLDTASLLIALDCVVGALATTPFLMAQRVKALKRALWLVSDILFSIAWIILRSIDGLTPPAPVEREPKLWGTKLGRLRLDVRRGWEA